MRSSRYREYDESPVERTDRERTELGERLERETPPTKLMLRAVLVGRVDNGDGKVLTR